MICISIKLYSLEQLYFCIKVYSWDFENILLPLNTHNLPCDQYSLPECAPLIPDESVHYPKITQQRFCSVSLILETLRNTEQESIISLSFGGVQWLHNRAHISG